MGSRDENLPSDFENCGIVMGSGMVDRRGIVGWQRGVDPGQHLRNMHRLDAEACGVFLSREVVLSTVSGRNLLFNPADQRVFEINDMAAYIWCSLREGRGSGAIVDELAEQGIPPETASDFFKDALQEWSEKGILKQDPLTPAGLFGRIASCQRIGMLGLSILIRYRTNLFADVAPLFRHLEVAESTPDIIIDVAEREHSVELFRDGKKIFSVRGDELATTLKGQLLEEVLSGASYELALHAATLVRNNCAMLLHGHPGAGKTTLTLALVSAGFGFSGDDVAILDSRGQVVGVPFSPACKAGAWNLISRYRPEISGRPVFRRYDRRRVRYLEPTNLAATVPRKLGWVVLLDRQRNAGATLIPIDAVTAMRGMLREAYAQGRSLTASGFMALSHAANHANCYQLTYSDLNDAADLLSRTCR